MNIEDFNRNEKQQFFSSIKGIIKEVNKGDKFSSVTLEVGHERVRPVNLVFNEKNYDKFKHALIIEKRVSIAYYLTSKNKEGRWSTMANILSIIVSE